MASYTCDVSTHQTLTLTTADLITLSRLAEFVRITNLDASVALYGIFNASAAPTSAAANTFLVQPGESRVFRFPGNAGATVRLVGNGNAYAVETIDGAL